MPFKRHFSSFTYSQYINWNALRPLFLSYSSVCSSPHCSSFHYRAATVTIAVSCLPSRWSLLSCSQFGPTHRGSYSSPAPSCNSVSTNLQLPPKATSIAASLACKRLNTFPIDCLAWF
jgi:hypothetical protein